VIETLVTYPGYYMTALAFILVLADSMILKKK